MNVGITSSNYAIRENTRSPKYVTTGDIPNPKVKIEEEKRKKAQENYKEALLQFMGIQPGDLDSPSEYYETTSESFPEEENLKVFFERQKREVDEGQEGKIGPVGLALTKAFVLRNQDEYEEDEEDKKAIKNFKLEETTKAKIEKAYSAFSQQPEASLSELLKEVLASCGAIFPEYTGKFNSEEVAYALEEDLFKILNKFIFPESSWTPGGRKLSPYSIALEAKDFYQNKNVSFTVDNQVIPEGSDKHLACVFYRELQALKNKSMFSYLQKGETVSETYEEDLKFYLDSLKPFLAINQIHKYMPLESPLGEVLKGCLPENYSGSLADLELPDLLKAFNKFQEITVGNSKKYPEIPLKFSETSENSNGETFFGYRGPHFHYQKGGTIAFVGPIYPKQTTKENHVSSENPMSQASSLTSPFYLPKVENSTNTSSETFEVTWEKVLNDLVLELGTDSSDINLEKLKGLYGRYLDFAEDDDVLPRDPRKLIKENLGTITVYLKDSLFWSEPSNLETVDSVKSLLLLKEKPIFSELEEALLSENTSSQEVSAEFSNLTKQEISEFCKSQKLLWETVKNILQARIKAEELIEECRVSEKTGLIDDALSLFLGKASVVDSFNPNKERYQAKVPSPNPKSIAKFLEVAGNNREKNFSNNEQNSVFIPEGFVASKKSEEGNKKKLTIKLPKLSNPSFVRDQLSSTIFASRILTQVYQIRPTVKGNTRLEKHHLSSESEGFIKKLEALVLSILKAKDKSKLNVEDLPKLKAEIESIKNYLTCKYLETLSTIGKISASTDKEQFQERIKREMIEKNKKAMSSGTKEEKLIAKVKEPNRVQIKNRLTKIGIKQDDIKKYLEFLRFLGDTIDEVEVARLFGEGVAQDQTLRI